MILRTTLPFACLGLALAALAACGEETPLPDGRASRKIECSSCHGDDLSDAPPHALSGPDDSSNPGVGAHRVHLTDTVIRSAIACSECHVVPEHVDDNGHVDALPAEVTFGPLSHLNGVEPQWNREQLSCATYCHGATLKGGRETTPTWTRVDGTQVRCDSCHGAPPPPPHTPDTHCARCHADTVDDHGNILVSAGHHIDGVVQTRGPDCGACHGGSDGAPPRDLAGNTEVHFPGVGAHAAHLDGTRHRAVLCTECHRVPTLVQDPGHIDDADGRAELSFSGLAVHDGFTPEYSEARCSNVYCHAGADDASRAAPAWTSVDGAFARCDACHGSPPALPHPARTDCASCHGAVVDVDGSFVDAALHVDGTVQSLGTGCAACHGTSDVATPWRDTSGNTDTSAVGVGAHDAHLRGADWHRRIDCNACHLTPNQRDDAGHYDTGLPAELVFGRVANGRGHSPGWDGVGCSNVACHVGKDSVGSVPVPEWTTVDGSASTCGACHAVPPPAPHPPRNDCAACHGEVIDASGTFIARSLHVDGVLQVSCSACHGDSNSPAPPADLTGGTSTSLIGVGAHRSHLDGSELFGPVACNQCHVVPTDVDDPLHQDGDHRAEVVFGPLARAEGTQASFDGLRCNTYCHGGSTNIADGSNTRPAWTTVNGSQASCGTCHAVPPPAPHPTVNPIGCGGCHPFIGLTPLDPSLHANGIVERP